MWDSDQFMACYSRASVSPYFVIKEQLGLFLHKELHALQDINESTATTLWLSCSQLNRCRYKKRCIRMHSRTCSGHIPYQKDPPNKYAPIMSYSTITIRRTNARFRSWHALPDPRHVFERGVRENSHLKKYIHVTSGGGDFYSTPNKTTFLSLCRIPPPLPGALPSQSSAHGTPSIDCGRLHSNKYTSSPLAHIASYLRAPRSTQLSGFTLAPDG